MADEAHPAVSLPENLWPTTRAAVDAIDGLHRLTGLPWWATLTLTAVGVRAALLPVSIRQMQASAAFWSQWRQAQQNVQARHWAAAGSSPDALRHVAAHSMRASTAPLAAAADVSSAASAAARMPAPQPQPIPGQHTSPAAAAAGLRAGGAAGSSEDAPQHAGPPVASASTSLTDSTAARTDSGADSSAPPHLAAAANHEDASSSTGTRWTTEPAKASQEEVEVAAGPSREGGARLAKTGAGGSLREVLAEARRLRAKGRAPHPAWILGAPAIQVSVFGTSVLAARAMAAAGWPGFAQGGALWFPDLTKAALVIDWGQDALSTTAAFPYGQLGAAMPVAVALALFANVSMAFGRGGPAPASGGGQAAVTAWLLGAVRVTMEWATVPVLALAMALPHGALVYWLASSACSLAQNAALQSLGVRRAFGLPGGAAPPSSAATAAKSVHKHADAGGDAPAATTSDIPQLFLRAAELRPAGEPDRALRLIERVLELQPGHPHARFAAGQLHAGQGRWAVAEQEYVAAAQLDAGDAGQRARCWFGAGVAQHAQGDLDAALQSFERASQLAEQAIAASSDVTGISGEGAALHSRPDEAVQKDREAGGRASTQAANRTLVRALMSQASILKRLRRLEEALLVARQAAVLDAAVQVHVRELEHELAEKKAPQ